MTWLCGVCMYVCIRLISSELVVAVRKTPDSSSSPQMNRAASG